MHSPDGKRNVCVYGLHLSHNVVIKRLSMLYLFKLVNSYNSADLKLSSMVGGAEGILRW